MRKRYTFLMTLVLGGAMSAIAQLDTIKIDLGNPSNTSAAPWNNITDEDQGSIADLLNHNGFTTGIAVAVTDSFNGNNTAGLAANDSLKVSPQAAGDSFFGSKVPAVEGHQVTGGLTFYHMDPNTPYSFAVYASRGSASDNRETKYIIEGATKDSANLNAAANSHYQVRFFGIYPAADSTIVLTATTGPNNNNASGYYYMGAVQITYVNTSGPGAKSLTLTSPNGGEYWEEGKQPEITWESTNLVNLDIEYSLNGGGNWSPVASAVPALSGSYSWTVPAGTSNNAMIRIFDPADATIADTSNMSFEIVTQDPNSYQIVVLGSSTAAGTGPTSLDSAWVWRYRKYITQRDTRFQVINLAVGGFQTKNIIPSGNPNNNINKAMTYVPDAIIVNLPSNDATSGVPVTTQLANYGQVSQIAAAGNSSLWVATPQPRDLTDPAKLQIQMDMVDSTYAVFGSFAIDFWTGFNETDGTLVDAYDSGDGIHMNDPAHKILFERVIGKDIYNYVLNNPNPNPDNIGLAENRIEGLRIYPNPASDRIQLDVSGVTGADLQSFEMYNLSGQKVMADQFPDKVTSGSVNLVELPAGIYILKVATNKGAGSRLIIVQ
ncbi:MAG: T9SS type A sorting domain-containing protein [Owenweeksia sp.]